jgi:NADH:ubiquinone oxidoreductase subunit 2 (subunit N)
MAFFAEKNKTLKEKKKFTLLLCEAAARVCLIAAVFSLFRLLILKEVFLYNETARFGLLLTTFFILHNSHGFLEKHPTRPLNEYSFFIITCLCFLLVLIEAKDFILLFTGLLGFSISLYVLIMMF